MGKLTEEQIEKLNAIGFEWDFLEARWEENFALLLAYKEKYGHCRVPKTKPEAYALYVWCNNVRSDYKSGTLSAERIKKLESVGFMWNITDALWHERYENLREHVNKHTWEGIYRKNLLLAGWVSKQRKSYKQGKLAEEKIMLLNMLGIEWKP